jgi:two-component system, sensor histidine kinase
MEKQELPGKKILIADDTEVNVVLLTSLLKTWGCESAVAVDGDQAVSMATATPYDVILMDIHMPKLNGVQAIRKIRGFSKVPIIAITGSMSTADLRAAMSAGVNDYILKPVKRDHLLELLKKYLLKA